LNPEPGTDQLRYKVSISIKLAAFQASGSAYMKLRLAGTENRLNVEHRTSNPPEADYKHRTSNIDGATLHLF
jgi:hypothetical protein